MSFFQILKILENNILMRQYDIIEKAHIQISKMFFFFFSFAFSKGVQNYKFFFIQDFGRMIHNSPFQSKGQMIC